MSRTQEHAFVTLRTVLVTAGTFLYRHLPWAVLLSLVWTVLCLPIVTVGPATLGAYAAVRSLDETGRVSLSETYATIAEHAVFAITLGIGLAAFAAIAGLYASAFLRTGDVLAGVLGVSALYALLFIFSVFSYVFLALVDGADRSVAIDTGYRAIVGSPVVSGGGVIVMLLTFGALALTRIGAPLLFPATAFAIHATAFDAVNGVDVDPPAGD